MTRSIITVGHAALDFVYRIDAFPPQPTKLRAREHIVSGGGMAANAAAAAARLGGHSSLWARVGADAAGDMIRAELQRLGVDVSSVRQCEGRRSATAAVIVDAQGERLIVSEDDHEMPMAAGWLPLQTIAGAGAVLSDLSWIEGTQAAFREAQARAVPTLIDLDTGGERFLSEVLPLAGYVIASRPALERFVTGADTRERLETLLRGGAAHAGVTLGAAGYIWMTREAGGRIFEQPAFFVTAVDTTGAGDAFHGAFAWALARGHPDAQCAAIGAAAAALKCRRLGAREGLPTRPELEALLGSTVLNPV